MNLRRGLARLGRALSIAYWALSAVAVGLTFRDGMLDWRTYEMVWNWDQLGHALSNCAQVVGWALLIYAILWAIAYGASWVLAGFTDTPKAN